MIIRFSTAQSFSESVHGPYMAEGASAQPIGPPPRIWVLGDAKSGSQQENWQSSFRGIDRWFDFAFSGPGNSAVPLELLSVSLP